jgi:hypothetical protein
MDEQMAPAPEQSGEDQIIDQIGELLKQLSPEKQQAVIAMLSELSGGAQDEIPVQTVSPEGGPNGKPARF